MRATATLPLLSGLFRNAIAQFITEPVGLTSAVGGAGVRLRYKEVPVGICELDPMIKSFSGYADVADNNHIFFWFFEARNQNATEAPLTVWLNGGPGSSSMFGLFTEVGPCRIDASGKPVNNLHSWTNRTNLLVIDQPAGTGFSYTTPRNRCSQGFSGVSSNCGTFSSNDDDVLVNSTLSAAPHFWKTLQGFMGVFPQYARNGFHIATESYGGHYGPIFGQYLKEQNAIHVPGAVPIDLQSVLIGNGCYDAPVTYEAYYNFTVSPGNTYGIRHFTKRQEQQLYDALYGSGNCLDQIKSCRSTKQLGTCLAAMDYCDRKTQGMYLAYWNNDAYDVRSPSQSGAIDSYVKYLNTPRVLQAIGARINYTDSSDAVNNRMVYSGDEILDTGILDDVRKLLDANVTVAMVAGDADFVCSWYGGETIANRVGASRAGWDKAGYANITTSDGVVSGQVKQAGKFSFSRIYESGHFVPFFQPVAALELLDRVMRGKDIETGKVDTGGSYSTQGVPKSTYQERKLAPAMRRERWRDKV
ncbi:alpha/beta-hydrolase [Thozetella sp. PMI_491]|nr:alpha/beta-hydrolase [Thozetella sp. PMI_491]